MVQCFVALPPAFIATCIRAATFRFSAENFFSIGEKSGFFRNEMWSVGKCFISNSVLVVNREESLDYNAVNYLPLLSLTRSEGKLNLSLGADVINMLMQTQAHCDEGLRKLDSKDDHRVMNEGITASLLGHHKNNRPCILPPKWTNWGMPNFRQRCPKDRFWQRLSSLHLANSEFNMSIASVHVHSGLHHHPPVMAHGGKVGNMGILIDSLITSDLSRELVNTVVSELQTVQLTGTSIVTTSQFSAWVFREDVDVVLTAAKIAHAMAKMRVLEDANQDEKEVKENIDDDSDAEDENEDSEDDENFAAAPYYWPLSHSFDTAAPPTTLDAIRNELMNEYSAATTPRVDLSELAIGIDSVSRDITKSGHSAKTRKTLITAGLSDVCASVIRSNKIGLMVETGAIVIA
ncbi:hypothetical protein BLNAU_6318 [Blattamonas nauphoetae]|uniref:Uncharacterized protein n=1 Tax=Blattamonas nauphoetae TaxID=2049346 RepID=A0ABQ9Y4Z3_9EUKA|nr:hypothetical protein BLNAU_6318 [Blattamonas nauphoetae]